MFKHGFGGPLRAAFEGVIELGQGFQPALEVGPGDALDLFGELTGLEGRRPGSDGGVIGREALAQGGLEDHLLDLVQTLLATRYAVDDGAQALLVLNIHAVNFVGARKFSRQVAQVVELIEAHAGPLLLAGL